MSETSDEVSYRGVIDQMTNDMMTMLRKHQNSHELSICAALDAVTQVLGWIAVSVATTSGIPDDEMRVILLRQTERYYDDAVYTRNNMPAKGTA